MVCNRPPPRLAIPGLAIFVREIGRTTNLSDNEESLRSMFRFGTIRSTKRMSAGRVGSFARESIFQRRKDWIIRVSEYISAFRSGTTPPLFDPLIAMPLLSRGI